MLSTLMNQLHTFEFYLFNKLQQIQTPYLNEFFKLLNYFDTQEFLFILIPMIWIGYNWKTGMKVLFIMLLSYLVNDTLKHVFLQPRPFHLYPNLAIIKVGGYGFPSGAAQTTIILAGALINAWRSRWAWVVAANYVFWIGLSRVYLGVHFISDVFGGWIVGAFLLLIYLFLFPAVENYLNKKPIWVSLALSFLVPIALLLSLYSKHTLTIAATLIGVGLGASISCRYRLNLNPPKGWLEFAGRSLLGIVGLFALAKGMSLTPLYKTPEGAFLQFFLIGMWLGVVANLVWRGLLKVVRI